MELEPYLYFTGLCEDALNFYSRIFGGKIEGMMRYEGSPMESQVPPDYKKKVMHARFKSPSLHFMAADGRPGTTQPGGNISLSLGSRSLSEAQRVWEKLAEGGRVDMPFQDMFWGAKFGQLTDRFGIDWMINCEPPKRAAARTSRARRARPARGRPARRKGGSRRARR